MFCVVEAAKAAIRQFVLDFLTVVPQNSKQANNNTQVIGFFIKYKDVQFHAKKTEFLLSPFFEPEPITLLDIFVLSKSWKEYEHDSNKVWYYSTQALIVQSLNLQNNSL